MMKRMLALLVWTAVGGACGKEPTSAIRAVPLDPIRYSDDAIDKRRVELETEATRLGWKEFAKQQDLAAELLRIYYALSVHPSVIGTLHETAILEKGLRLARDTEGDLSRRVEVAFEFRCRLFPFAARHAARSAGDPKAAEIAAVLKSWSEDEYEPYADGAVAVTDKLHLTAFRAGKPAPESAMLFHRIYYVESENSLAFYTLATHRLEGERVHYLVAHYANTMRILSVYKNTFPPMDRVERDLIAHARGTLKLWKGDRS